MRSSSVCFFCKRRKIKCDKGTPCSACIKYNESVCEYDTYQDVKSNGNASVGACGGAVLDLDVRAPSSRRGTKRTSEVQTELDILKKKISVLEQSVSLKHSMDKSSHTFYQLDLPQQPIPPYNSSQIVAPHHSVLQLPLQHPLVSNMNSYWQTQPVLPTLQSNSSHSSIDNATPSDPSLLWLTPTKLSEILRISYPYPSDVKTFSFHRNYTPFIWAGASTARYIPPLCWVSLVKIDPALAPIFAYKRSTIADRLVHDVPVQPSDKVFQDKVVLGIVEDFKYENPKRRHFVKEKSEMVDRYNESAMLVGLTVFGGEIDPNLDIASKVKSLLPSRKVIWSLIDRFFILIYPFYPLLDQFDFEEQVSEILGSRNRDHVQVTTLNIKKKMDVITCGLLLLVLRLAYLSIITNDVAYNETIFKGSDNSEDGQERTFLMHNPIHIDVIDVAQQCLHYFGYLRFSNLSILQLSIFIQVYQCYAPENGEGYEDVTVKGHTSMLIHMAMSLGLHREPVNELLTAHNLRSNNLCRKIWWYLLILDANATIASGVHLSIGRKQFDTKPPYYSERCSNIKDIAMEKTIIALISSFDPKFDEVLKLSDLFSNLEPLIPISEISSLLSAIEVDYAAVDNEKLSLDGILSESFANHDIYEETVRGLRMKVKFQHHICLLSISFHFFCYFEKLGNIDHAYFYMKKLLFLTMKNMMLFYNAYVNNSLTLFPRTSDIPITPTFQALMHKCMICLQSILARVRFSILQCETSTTHKFLLQNHVSYKQRYDLLCETWDIAESCLQVFVNHTTKLGSRFYYSWRCAKAQIVLKEIRHGTDYYQNYRKGNELYMTFNNAMLEDMLGILKESLGVIAEKKKDSFDDHFNALSGVYMDEDTRSLSTVPIPEMPSYDDDQLWNQMIMVKPQLRKSMQYNVTPPEVGFDSKTDFFDVSSGYTSNMVFPELNGFFDSMLEGQGETEF